MRAYLRLAVFVGLGLASSAACADDRSFDIDHLQLALTRSSFVATEGAAEIPKWDYRAAVAYHFIQSPLVLERTGERREVVQDRSTLEVQGAVQFGRWVGLGYAMPFVVADRGSSDVGHGAAVGDLRLVPRVEMLHRGRFGLAVLLGLKVPTGAHDRFVGEGMVVFEPRFAFQVKLGMFDLGTNVGIRIRESRSYLDLRVGNEIFMSLAASVTPRPYISAVIELHGDTAMNSRFAQNQSSPLTLLFGLFGQWKWLRGGLAAGFGLNEGWGAPRAQVLAMFEYRRWNKPPVVIPPPAPQKPPEAHDDVIPPEPKPPEPTPEPEPEPDPGPIITPEEPDVAVHLGRIELADPIFFDKDRKRVRHRFFPELQQLARVLNKRSELAVIWIEGHADATGPERWNLELSRHRAEAVAQILITNGVKAERLKPVGFGEARPLVNTRHGESNEKNRRVHFFTDKAPDVKTPALPALLEPAAPADPVEHAPTPSTPAQPKHPAEPTHE